MVRRCLSVLALGALSVSVPAARASTSYGCQTNGGVTVKVCVFQDAASDLIYGDEEQIRVTDYRVSVRNLDRHSVRLASVSLRATVFGRCVSHCRGYEPGAVHTHRFRRPHSRHRYKMRVPWRHATIQVTRDGRGYQAGNALVRYWFRGHLKSFQTGNVCAGLLPGSGGAFCNL